MKWSYTMLVFTGIFLMGHSLVHVQGRDLWALAELFLGLSVALLPLALES